MLVQEGVGGVLERRHATRKWNNLRHRGLLLGCRSKRGQLEDRRREDLTDVFRLVWEHGVDGQAQVIKGMQQIIHSYTLLQDKEALSGAVANVRWLIAAGIRDFQAMLDALGKLQTGLSRDAPAPDEPIHDD